MDKIICIAGPTASGKTALAVELAKVTNGEVVSCDSMQVYRRMDIGTAKPTLEEMQGIAHHMLSVCEPEDDFSVSLSGMDLKAYGSQGQTRTAAISLKLAQRQLMANQSSQMPLLLLDDVLSELDPQRQDFVLNQISSGQVFITCCEPEKFTKLGKTITIEKGALKA